jgi:hypothetical protein
MGSANRAQNVAGAVPMRSCTSTGPCDVASSPYVTPPLVFSLIVPPFTEAALLVTRSFHLYVLGVPVAGETVQPGAVPGACPSTMH